MAGITLRSQLAQTPEHLIWYPALPTERWWGLPDRTCQRLRLLGRLLFPGNQEKNPLRLCLVFGGRAGGKTISDAFNFPLATLVLDAGDDVRLV